METSLGQSVCKMTKVLPCAAAIAAVLGPYYSEAIGGVARWIGWQIPLHEIGAWVCPAYHPSYVMRTLNAARETTIEAWTRRHLREAFALAGTPLPPAPPIGRSVSYPGPDEAGAVLARWAAREDSLFAWDFETNMLKPDYAAAEIVSAAVCRDGEETVAFPWTAAVADPMRLFLRGRGRKIGANIKFEERWVRAFLGCSVRNWTHDTVLAAHALDNRHGVTSVNFQALVRLGVASYDGRVKPYLEESRPGRPNRIRRIPLDRLLRYNATDAAVEYHLGVLQMKELGR